MTNPSSPRRLAAILIADAVGFSRLVGEDEARTLRLLGQRRLIIEEAILAHGGRVFGGAGDSVVAEFPSAVDAVSAGLKMQREINELNNNSSPEEIMQFRVGINLGDVVVEGDNLLGDGVNVAERIQSVAPPGGICISANIHEHIRGKVDLPFRDIGEKSLKNISHPVRLHSLELAADRTSPRSAASKLRRARTTAVIAALAVAISFAVASFFWPFRLENHTKADSGPPVVAVLPFDNLSGSSADDYLGEGVAGDIAGALGRFSGISIVAKNAVLQFKGKTDAVGLIREKLGAGFLVAGSIQRSGNHIKVNVSLIDATTNRQLWSEHYDRQPGDIFAVQDEIVTHVAGLLVDQVNRTELERTFQKPPESLDAYGLLLRGRYEMSKRTRQDNAKARALFEQATALNPRFAAALTAQGFTYLYEAMQGWTEFYADALAKAEELAKRALVIEPDLAEGHQLLSEIYTLRREFDRALREAKQAIALNPSYAYGYADQAFNQLLLGDTKGVIENMELALKLDPTLDVDYRHPLGFAYVLEDRYDDAIALFESVAGTSDAFPYVGLAVAYAKQGRLSEAKSAVDKARAIWPFLRIKDIASLWQNAEAAGKIAEGMRKAGFPE